MFIEQKYKWMNDWMNDQISLLYSDIYIGVYYFLDRKAWLLLHLGYMDIILQMSLDSYT